MLNSIEYKYKIYKMLDGKTYLSTGCPKCSKTKIELNKEQIELIKKVREIDTTIGISVEEYLNKKEKFNKK